MVTTNDPLSTVTHQRDILRAALVGLIGAEDEQELRAMEAVIRHSPAPEADKSAMLNAIHAMLECLHKE